MQQNFRHPLKTYREMKEKNNGKNVLIFRLNTEVSVRGRWLNSEAYSCWAIILRKSSHTKGRTTHSLLVMLCDFFNCSQIGTSYLISQGIRAEKMRSRFRPCVYV